MLGPWVQQDFDAARAFVDSVGKKGGRDAIKELFSHLARIDLAVAQERALALPAGEERDKALAGLAVVMAQSNLAGTLQWLHQQGLEDDDHLLLIAARRDPSSVAECVLQHPGWFENSRGPSRVGDFFQKWAEGDFAAAQAWLAANPLPEKLQRSAEEALTRVELDQLPFETAVTAWQGLPEAQRKRLTDRMIERLMAEDPAHALERIVEMAPEEKRAEAMFQVIRNTLQDRKQILRWLPELAGYLRRNSHHIGMLSGFSPEEVQAAISGLPAEDQRSLQIALAEHALNGGNVDPEYVLAMLPGIDPHAKDPFIYSRLAVEMAQADPARAAAWVEDFPEGSSKEWAARNLVASWAKFDPEAAAAWVEKLPAGASRDRSIVELAYLQGLAGDHQAAVRAAGGVGDEGQRAEAYGFALQNLWWRDAAAAEQALAGASLSPEQRVEVLGELQTDGYRR